MDYKEQKLLERITLKPDLLGGKPTIRGIRFLVTDILELVSSGMSQEDILEQHPILKKKDIEAALLYSSLIDRNEEVFIIPEHMKKAYNKVWKILEMETLLLWRNLKRGMKNG